MWISPVLPDSSMVLTKESVGFPQLISAVSSLPVARESSSSHSQQKIRSLCASFITHTVWPGTIETWRVGAWNLWHDLDGSRHLEDDINWSLVTCYCIYGMFETFDMI